MDCLRNGCPRRRGIGDRVKHRKIVDSPVISGRNNFNPGTKQSAGVCLPFIAQHVVLGRDDERAW
jgi:hypothetical protein